MNPTPNKHNRRTHMTDMREKIAAIIEANTGGNYLDSCEEACAILSALPGMMLPLVWDANSAELDFPCSYSFDGDDEDGWTVILVYRTCSIDLPEGGEIYLTLEAAKAAANDHHVAQIMRAFGIAQGGE